MAVISWRRFAVGARGKQMTRAYVGSLAGWRARLSARFRLVRCCLVASHRRPRLVGVFCRLIERDSTRIVFVWGRARRESGFCARRRSTTTRWSRIDITSMGLPWCDRDGCRVQTHPHTLGARKLPANHKERYLFPIIPSYDAIFHQIQDPVNCLPTEPLYSL